MARLRWAGPARSDLARIEDFYATLDPEFAIRAIDSALEAAEFLLDRPRAGPTFTDGALRKWRVPATPLLLIIYQIEPDGILIVRVQHNRSDWQSLP
jgi:plasmid stabilization system protein ParE